MEIWYLLISKKFSFWSFREWEIRSFFEPKSWWKDDIYWLLKMSLFELFGVGKYGLFWVKKLMARWYLLVTEKFLFWTFPWWEIGSFFQPKSWWKDDIYLVFLSFSWYSRTLEIWFFAQCRTSFILFTICSCSKLFGCFISVSHMILLSPCINLFLTKNELKSQDFKLT